MIREDMQELTGWNKKLRDKNRIRKGEVIDS